jgi:hypothetical protein
MPPNQEIKAPLWFSVSSAAKIGGIDQKTIRRALKNGAGLKYKIIKDRYRIELGSLLAWLDKNTKLRNKFQKKGLGQYFPTKKIT